MNCLYRCDKHVALCSLSLSLSRAHNQHLAKGFLSFFVLLQEQTVSLSGALHQLQ